MPIDFTQFHFFSAQHLTAWLFYFYCYVIGAVWLPQSKTLMAEKTPILPIYLHLFFAITLGLSITILVLFLLGSIGHLRMIPTLLMMTIPLGFSLYQYINQKYFPLNDYLPLKHPLQLCRSIFTSLNFWFLFSVFLTISIAYTGILGHSDDTWYHLPHALDYLKKGNLSLNAHLHIPLVAQNIELLFSWSLMFGNIVLAQAMATLPLFLIVLGFFGLSYYLSQSTLMGMIASILWLTSHTATATLGFAYVDIATAQFAWASVLALLYYADQTPSHLSKPSFHWLILSAIFLGVSIGSKILAGPLLIILLIWLLFQRQYKASLWFLVITSVVGCGWYVRSFLISGNPVHPIGSSLFGYFLWEPIDYQTLAIERELINSSNWLKNLFIQTKGIYCFLAFIPIFFVKTFKTVPIKRTVKLFTLLWLSLSLIWFFTTQVERYLTIGYLFVCFLTGLLAYIVIRQIVIDHEKHHKILEAILACVLIFLSVFNTFLVYQKNRYQFPEKFLFIRPAVGSTLYKKANELIPQYGPRILNLSFHRGVIFFDGEVYGGWFGPERLIDFCTDKTQTPTLTPFCTVIPAKDVLKRMVDLNTKMLLLNTNRFKVTPDYEQFFDIKASTAEGFLYTIKEQSPPGK